MSNPVQPREAQWVGGGLSVEEFPKVSLQDHLHQNHPKNVLNLEAWDFAFLQAPHVSLNWHTSLTHTPCGDQV